jgi:FkbM family methyltransferase
MSYNGLIFDNVIKKHLNYENGLYIEAGANNGIIGSNTLFLEKELNWSGVLIEPSKNAFDVCVQHRNSNNIFINSALVGDDNIEEVVGDFNGDHMSSINGARTGCNLHLLTSVKATTLTKILDQSNFSTIIDFFSLDVEGHELEVLKGINFKKYSFKFLLIEVNTRNYKLSDILSYIEPYNYSLFDNITKYNSKEHPTWSKDHNDFLFINEDLFNR